MNYDDVPMADTNDEGYTPLQRPAALADMTTHGEQPQERPFQHALPPLPPPSNFNGGNDFGARGQEFGNNRGARGTRGNNRPHRGRGGFGQQRSPVNNYHGGFPQKNGYSNQGHSSAPRVPNINVPHTPNITPQNAPYQSMTPSPITPLPNVSFNFGRGFQPPSNFPSFPPPPGQGIPGLTPPPPFPQPFNFQQPQQQHHFHPPPPPPPQHSYNTPPTANASQANPFTGAWASNPAVAAALQRQIEEQRRAQGQ
jgi:hypothetical protein